MKSSILKNIIPAYKAYSELLIVRPEWKKLKKATEKGNHEAAQQASINVSRRWGKDLIRRFHATVTVEGYENLPEEGPVLFVSNHQSYADIPTIYYALDKFQFGFIAKDNIAKVPVYGRWAADLGGVFLERENPRKALETFKGIKEKIKQGYSFLIFPEGTRSQGGPMKEFKRGSFKLAFETEVPIVPITLIDTWKLFERQGYFKGDKCKVIIHEPIQTKGLSREEQVVLTEKIQDIVQKDLLNNQ